MRVLNRHKKPHLAEFISTRKYEYLQVGPIYQGYI